MAQYLYSKKAWQTLKKVAYGLFDHEIDLGTYHQKAIFIMRLGEDGGLVVRKEINYEGEKVGWIDLYAPGNYPNPSNWRHILAILGTMDVDLVAVNIDNCRCASPRLIRSTCEGIGLQKVADEVYSVRLTPYEAVSEV